MFCVFCCGVNSSAEQMFPFKECKWTIWNYKVTKYSWTNRIYVFHLSLTRRHWWCLRFLSCVSRNLNSSITRHSLFALQLNFLSSSFIHFFIHSFIHLFSGFVCFFFLLITFVLTLTSWWTFLHFFPLLLGLGRNASSCWSWAVPQLLKLFWWHSTRKNLVNSHAPNQHKK
jgi:hypothetical protein